MSNLGWKLAVVINGACDESLLETYELERMGHVKQMVAVSLGMAKEMTDHDPMKAAERDRIAANRTPEEREAQKRQAFKPQPKFNAGVVVQTPLPSFKTLPARDVPRMAGAIFPQPRATNAEGVEMLLDDATGQGWRVLMWNNNPMAFISVKHRAALEHLHARIVQVVPKAQLPWARRHAPEGVTVIGDLGEEGSLQAWFDARPVGAVVIRPDHVVAAECLAQELDDVLARVLDVAHFCLPQQ